MASQEVIKLLQESIDSATRHYNQVNMATEEWLRKRTDARKRMKNAQALYKFTVGKNQV